MTQTEKALFHTLVYYNLLNKPLTSVEIYKYLFSANPWPRVSFFELVQALQSLSSLKKIECQHGLYFTPRTRRQDLVNSREKRVKITQLKWRRLKKIGWLLELAPFLKFVGITGSLTSFNAQKNSDFDFLTILKNERLWTGRAFLSLLTWLLGAKRHGQKTENRVCLNCFLTLNNLEITDEFKPHNYHSAQEYSRLTPFLEPQKGTYQAFLGKNIWLKNFSANYPWPNGKNLNRLETKGFLSFCRRIIEWFLSGPVGDKLEKKLGRWQAKRIFQPKFQTPKRDRDQIYVSDFCLMLHPDSKNFQITNALQKCLKTQD